MLDVEDVKQLSRHLEKYDRFPSNYGADYSY